MRSAAIKNGKQHLREFFFMEVLRPRSTADLPVGETRLGGVMADRIVRLVAGFFL